MEREPTSPLFVRLPATSAERLSRAAFELKTPKREREADVVGRAETRVREPDVLTVEQLAEMLQVDEKTVRSLAAKGDVPGRKVGRHWRFSRQAVLDWLASPERRKGAAGFQS